MPRLIPVTHREHARKLRRAGYVDIRTSRHPVYHLAAKNITVPIPSHPCDVPKGTLRAIVREMGWLLRNLTRFEARPALI